MSGNSVPSSNSPTKWWSQGVSYQCPSYLVVLQISAYNYLFINTERRWLTFVICISFQNWAIQVRIFNLGRVVWGFPGSSAVKNLPVNAGDVGLIPELGRFLEKETATHSSIIAWEIPWTEGSWRAKNLWVAKESDTTQWLNNNNRVMCPFLV